MAIKDKDLVKLHPNERIDLPDFRAIQSNARSEAREFLQACVMSGSYRRAGESSAVAGHGSVASGMQQAANQAFRLDTGNAANNTMWLDNGTGYGKDYIVKPFRIVVAADGNSLQVTAGVATTGLYDDDGTPGTEHGIMIGLTGDTVQTVDIAALAAETWHYIYVTASLDDTKPSSRVFWNATAANEVGQTVTTRKSFGWDVQITPGIDNTADDKGWLLIGLFYLDPAHIPTYTRETGYSLGEGRTYQHGNIVPGGKVVGNPTQEYNENASTIDPTIDDDDADGMPITMALAWGDGPNDRDIDRMTYGCHSLAEFLDAVRRQLQDIIGLDHADGRAWYNSIPKITTAGGGATVDKEVNLHRTRLHIQDSTDPHGTVLNQSEMRLSHLNSNPEGGTIVCHDDFNALGSTVAATQLIAGDVAADHLRVTSTAILGQTAANVADGGNLTTVMLGKADATIKTLTLTETTDANVALTAGSGDGTCRIYGDGHISIDMGDANDGETTTAITCNGLVKADGFVMLNSDVVPVSYVSSRTVTKTLPPMQAAYRAIYPTGTAVGAFHAHNFTNTPPTLGGSEGRGVFYDDYGNVEMWKMGKNPDPAQTDVNRLHPLHDVTTAFGSAAFAPTSHILADILAALMGYNSDHAYAPKATGLRIFLGLEYDRTINYNNVNVVEMIEWARKGHDQLGFECKHIQTSSSVPDLTSASVRSRWFSTGLGTNQLLSQCAQYDPNFLAPGNLNNTTGLGVRADINQTVALPQAVNFGILNYVTRISGDNVRENVCILVSLDPGEANSLIQTAGKNTIDGRYPVVAGCRLANTTLDDADDSQLKVTYCGMEIIASCKTPNAF